MLVPKDPAFIGFRFDHENSVNGNNYMIDLRRSPVGFQHDVIEDKVFILRQRGEQLCMVTLAESAFDLRIK
jgi:hypothetical protein